MVHTHTHTHEAACAFQRDIRLDKRARILRRAKRLPGWANRRLCTFTHFIYLTLHKQIDRQTKLERSVGGGGGGLIMIIIVVVLLLLVGSGRRRRRAAAVINTIELKMALANWRRKLIHLLGGFWLALLLFFINSQSNTSSTISRRLECSRTTPKSSHNHNVHVYLYVYVCVCETGCLWSPVHLCKCH